MSKKMLLFCASLAGVCLAGDEVVEQVESSQQLVEQVDSGSVVVDAGPVVEPVVEAPQSDVPAPTTHELPGIRIDQGPVVVEPSYGCSEENIEALAHATVQALHATLSDVAATTAETSAKIEAPVANEEVEVVDAVENKVEDAHSEIEQAFDAVSNAVSEVSEAVDAVEDIVSEISEKIEDAQEAINKEGFVPAIISFISNYYNWFVEFFKQGWKYMVYNSVNRATRHIVLSAGHRSPVDLTALAQVNDFAVDCFSKMNEAKSAILAAAEQRSPQLRQATELYLQSYENWFKGQADAFVDLTATRAMLDCLGVKNIDASAFSTRNLDHFKSRGGEIRHSNLFLIVSPGEIAKYEPVVFEEAPVQV